MYGDNKSSHFFVSEQKLSEESLRRIYSFGITTVKLYCIVTRLFLKISTEMKREDIIQSLMTRKIVIFQKMSLMNVDYFRYLVISGNFLNFQLCEIQLGVKCLLSEHEPLNCLLVMSYYGKNTLFSLKLPRGPCYTVMIYIPS